MVTTEQILEATGLRAAKTLTRWQRAGVIPAPQIGTHPSGRGKTGFYPDWVLDRCRRVLELQKQGHTLRSAVTTLETERLRSLIEEIAAQPSLAEILKRKTIRRGDGLKVDLLTVAHAVILNDLGPLLDPGDLRQTLLHGMAAQGAAGRALELLQAGYSPVLVTDGTGVEVVADFLVSHWLSGQGRAAAPLLVFPLLPALRRILPKLLADVAAEKLAAPAPAVWVRQGDAVLEYPILLIDTELGFELIREGARTVSAGPPAQEAVDEADP
jgi:hypothetical protein